MASCTPTHGGTNRSVDWQSLLDQSIRSPAELCRRLDLDPSLGVEAESAGGNLPLLVPAPYAARIRRGDPNDPLLRQVLPRTEETLATPGFDADPLGETTARCGPGLLRKYRGRILMVTAGACAVHCRFCFRRHFPYSDCPQNAVQRASALEHIAADRSLHEVILSGGDPLMLTDAELARLLAQLTEIPHVRRVRLHSRMPVVLPQRVTSALVELLRAGRITPIMVIHVNHAAEIDRSVADGFARLIDGGVPVLSQTVLLHGVNDRADVLVELFGRLVDLRVVPYYLHQLDPVAGAAHFQVPIETGKSLVAALRARLPGYAVPRYVRETPGGDHKEVLA
ncbi:MAG: EF-P beta-lysylation protein EpmB [Thermoguttaceae bacterium]